MDANGSDKPSRWGIPHSGSGSISWTVLCSGERLDPQRHVQMVLDFFKGHSHHLQNLLSSSAQHWRYRQTSVFQAIRCSRDLGLPATSISISATSTWPEQHLWVAVPLGLSPGSTGLPGLCPGLQRSSCTLCGLSLLLRERSWLPCLLL